MKLRRLDCFICVLCFFSIITTSFGKAWKGAEPGVFTKVAVIKKFGKPTRDFTKGGKLSNGINYKGKQAIEGAREANFFFDANQVLFRIDVFPSRMISREDIVRIFGDKYVERTAKSGHTVYIYIHEGMMVTFDKDKDTVASFRFTEAMQGKIP